MHMDIATAPRRIRLDQNIAAELKIYEAIQEVERLDADIRLTEAVMLLGQAKEKVADWVDGVPLKLVAVAHKDEKVFDGLLSKERRQQVLDIISAERDYQNTRWPSGDQDKSVAEWIVYLDHLLAKAKASVYELNRDEAMTMIRNIAAVCVACMEYNAVPSREPKS